ncbi:putative estradiol 17 beta-dehydrogenase [Xylariales sp. PMI_506]|nr:putative estradiol 17 beta-dehydrogenase [Xylariales sp. PMI_506]
MAPGPTLKSTWTQFFPPKSTFTAKDIPDLSGKVYIVSGSNSGVGQEVAKLLYSKNGKVYIAARSEEKATKAIADIKAAVPSSSGSLVFLHLDLDDLNLVKTAAQKFLAQERELHVLFNNAGVMVSPEIPMLKTAQGYEQALGVNCVATFLFTKLLTPILIETARKVPAGTVRVVWLSSFGLEIFAKEGVGMDFDNLDYHDFKDHTERYGMSKVGDWALGVEYARRHKDDGIISVPINPGNLRTELARSQGVVFRKLAGMIVYPPINGAYTELFAAFSPELTKTDWSKYWVIPFARIAPLRQDLPRAATLESEGGTGGTHKFWEWNEEQVKPYL